MAASPLPSPQAGAPGEDCGNEKVGRVNAAELRVRDVMLASPKTVPAGGTVGDLRALFANSHVMTALVVDGPRFVGVVHREDVADGISDAHPAGELASRDIPTTEPNAALTDALAVLDSRNERRLVVLDIDGDRLCGLLCLTRDRQGFCQS